MGVCWGMGVVKVLWEMVVDGSSWGSMGGDCNSGVVRRVGWLWWWCWNV